MDALFIYPKTGLDIGGTISPPFGTMFAGSILDEENYDVKIVDQRIESDWKSKVSKELKKNPVVVGISCMTGPQIHHAIETAKFVKKESGSVIVFGGPHPTMKPKQTLQNKYVDIVVRNEGEKTFYELVKALKNKQNLRKIKGIAFKKNNETILTEPRRLLRHSFILGVNVDIPNIV